MPSALASAVGIEPGAVVRSAVGIQGDALPAADVRGDVHLASSVMDGLHVQPSGSIRTPARMCVVVRMRFSPLLEVAAGEPADQPPPCGSSPAPSPAAMPLRIAISASLQPQGSMPVPSPARVAVWTCMDASVLRGGGRRRSGPSRCRHRRGHESWSSSPALLVCVWARLQPFGSIRWPSPARTGLWIFISISFPAAGMVRPRQPSGSMVLPAPARTCVRMLISSPPFP